MKILPYASKVCDRHDLDVRKYVCARTYLPFSPTKQFYGGRDYYNVTISKIVGDGPWTSRELRLRNGANRPCGVCATSRGVWRMCKMNKTMPFAKPNIDNYIKR